MCNEESKKKRMTNFSYFGTGTVDGKFAQVEIDHKKVSNEQINIEYISNEN